jgi:ubiquinone/menaquinone biosynthesis C-methylase UbiE
VSNPLFARIYPRINAYAEAHGALEHRRELLAQTSGTVLEVGAGTGANFSHYPQQVDRVVAVEPEPRLRAIAERAARQAAVPVEVHEGESEQLPVPDGSMDGVVASLVLCTLPNVPRALAEMRRVLRLGGRLYFYEHVQAKQRGLARRQRILNVIWPLVGGGCSLTRDTEQAIVDAGFEVGTVRRFDFLVNGRTTPSSPNIIGIARKPDDSAL